MTNKMVYNSSQLTNALRDFYITSCDEFCVRKVKAAKRVAALKAIVAVTTEPVIEAVVRSIVESRGDDLGSGEKRPDDSEWGAVRNNNDRHQGREAGERDEFSGTCRDGHVQPDSEMGTRETALWARSDDGVTLEESEALQESIANVESEIRRLSAIKSAKLEERDSLVREVGEFMKVGPHAIRESLKCDINNEIKRMLEGVKLSGAEEQHRASRTSETSETSRRRVSKNGELVSAQEERTNVDGSVDATGPSPLLTGGEKGCGVTSSGLHSTDLTSSTRLSPHVHSASPLCSPSYHHTRDEEIVSCSPTSHVSPLHTTSPPLSALRGLSTVSSSVSVLDDLPTLGLDSAAASNGREQSGIEGLVPLHLVGGASGAHHSNTLTDVSRAEGSGDTPRHDGVRDVNNSLNNNNNKNNKNKNNTHNNYSNTNPTPCGVVDNVRLEQRRRMRRYASERCGVVSDESHSRRESPSSIGTTIDVRTPRACTPSGRAGGGGEERSSVQRGGERHNNNNNNNNNNNDVVLDNEVIIVGSCLRRDDNEVDGRHGVAMKFHHGEVMKSKYGRGKDENTQSSPVCIPVDMDGVEATQPIEEDNEVECDDDGECEQGEEDEESEEYTYVDPAWCVSQQTDVCLSMMAYLSKKCNEACEDLNHLNQAALRVSNYRPL